jgi:protein involved in polysaccharide export with SLBB domain
MRAYPTILLLVLFCACATQHRQPAVSDSGVRPGDCLIFQVEQSSDFGIRRVVDSTGDISLPDIGTLHVAGMTLEQVAQAVDDRYAPKVSHRTNVSRRSQ